MSAHAPSEPSKLAFSYIGFRFFWLTTLLVSFAVQIMSVSIAWQIYDVTGNAFLLGLVGLCLFLPALLLILGLPAIKVANTGALMEEELREMEMNRQVHEKSQDLGMMGLSGLGGAGGAYSSQIL